ncbi:hypothetical protein QQF64_012704 [Cirrhinus molitorella]|uniref:Uncharacterized protein n=1 Tax=Cirrhinus molitorella TaxID=172907 RepID=A0ABR3LZP7_9TELE
MLGTRHLFVTPSVSPLRLSLLGFSVLSHKFHKLLWRWHTVKFPSPRAPWSCGGDLISDQSRSPSRSLARFCHILSSLGRLCVNFLHVPVREKKGVLFWNLMILCVLKRKSERGCS